MIKLPTNEKKSAPVQAARNHLRRNGWTHRAAAERCGVSETHFSYVLNERRKSERLLRKIMTLPENPVPA